MVMEFSGTFEVVVAAQLIAGAAWGCILMSAFSAAAALGYTGAEGKTTGVLFSALALATFTRMGTTASGALNDPSLAPVLHWAPIACWAVGGAVLVVLSMTYMKDNKAA
jgi:putative copper export protein